MGYDPPTDVFAAHACLGHDAPLSPGDPRYVDLGEWRGESLYPGVSRSLGPRGIALVAGNRGSGKSTEVRHLAHDLSGPGGHHAVALDVLASLDPGAIECPDLLLGMAWALAEDLSARGAAPAEAATGNLWSWFAADARHDPGIAPLASRIEERLGETSGLDYVRTALGALVEAVRGGSAQGEAVRRVVRDSVAAFLRGLNDLIEGAEKALREAGGAGPILFVLDGTDRLGREATRDLFVGQAARLRAVGASILAPVPLGLLYERPEAHSLFDCFTLPLVAIENSAREPDRPACDAMAELLHRRAAPALFDSRATVETLVRFSGGAPGELLRLLHYAHLEGADREYTIEAALRAVGRRGVEFRRALRPPDIEALFRIDQFLGLVGGGEGEFRLLDSGAVFEYGCGPRSWLRTHPIVRTIEPYKAMALR